MRKINIGIIGPTGRMGSSIIRESEFFPNISISSLCEQKTHSMIGQKIGGVLVTDDVSLCIKNSDIIIDFSSPEATIQ